MADHKTSAAKTVKRGRDATRSARAAAHLQRLKESKGKRLVVDLDAPAREALETLLKVGRGSTQREIVCEALVSLARSRMTP